jgi:hypothetical protein
VIGAVIGAVIDGLRSRAARWLALAVAGAGCAACSVGPPGPGIDTSRAMIHVEALVALGPHPAGSPAAQRAARYIEDQLQASGILVERLPPGQVTTPAIDVLGVYRREARTHEATDPNLVVRLGPASGRALLVMAHYDTVATSPGAVDNSAAVAVLLELARMLAADPPRTPVMLAFTASEESGLVGAEALAARRGDDVALAVALDLIGGSGELTLNGASRLIGRAELTWLARAADRAGVVVRAPLPHRVVSRAWPQIERSDHGAFTRRGIAAVHLYHRGQDGERIDLAYHRAGDVASRVQRRSLDEIGRLLRALARTAPPAYDGDGFWLPVAINTVVPRWWLNVLDAGLAALALALLVSSRRSRAPGGLGIVVGIACYAAATAAAIAVEWITAGAHPAPWLHAPGLAVLAELAVLAGALGIATRVAGRFATWAGDRRYLAIAITVPLTIGVAALLAGGAELAWIWLVPAAAAALAPRLGRLGIVAVAVGILPGVLLLAPDQLREVAWNGFWPPGMSLAAYIAGLAIAPLAGLAWWMRRHPTGPLGTLLLPVGCGLAMIVGTAVMSQTHPRCSPRQFQDFHLACEALPKMR